MCVTCRMCGALTTYWLVNRDFTDFTVEKATERIVSQIESGELKIPGVFNSSCVVTVPEIPRPLPSVPGVTKVGNWLKETRYVGLLCYLQLVPAVTKVGWLRRPSLLLAVGACSHQGGLVNAWTLHRPSLLFAVSACSHQGG